MALVVDSGVLEAAKRGDVGALEHVLSECRPDLRRYAQLYCVTSADAEDAVQESLVIQSLPDIYREVIVLRDFEELLVREITERLGALSETVGTRIHRGRQMIREHLLA